MSAGPLLRVTNSSRFHAHPSLAVDGQDRLWIAYDEAPENWGKAIGSYERMLTTPFRFDQYLSGDAQALSRAEQRGFLETGCASLS